MSHSWLVAGLKPGFSSSSFFLLLLLHETVLMKNIIGYSFLGIVSSK